jgi:hypothetical protein
MDLRLTGQTAVVTGANVTGADITIDGGLIPTL